MTESAYMPILAVERPMPNVLLVRMSGNWRQRLTVPAMEVIQQALNGNPALKCLEFDTTDLSGSDSRFVAFISTYAETARPIESGSFASPSSTRHHAPDANQLLADYSFNTRSLALAI